MENKKKSSGIKKLLFTFGMILIALFITLQDAHGYSSSNGNGNVVDSWGFFYFRINGDKNTDLKIRIYRSSSPGWNTFRDYATTWTAKIDSGTNNHNVRFSNGSNQIDVTTKQDENGKYYIYNLPIVYDMPAHYQYMDWGSDRPGINARMNFDTYAMKNDSYNNTASNSGGHETYAKSRTINLQINASHCGIKTYSTMFYNSIIWLDIGKAEHYLDLNGLLDGAYGGDIEGFGTADVYINGVLKANDATDFWQKVPDNSTYEIRDIRSTAGHTYNGVASGSLSGVVCGGNKAVQLKYSTNYYTLDLNGVLDGSWEGWIGGYGTADVYINGTLVANDVSDYCTSHPYGTTYQITDIKSASGKQYNGVTSGSLSGTITSNIDVRLNFSTSLYNLNINPNGGSWNGSSNTQTIKLKKDEAYSFWNPTRDYHNFLGWTYSGGGGASFYQNGFTTISGTSLGDFSRNYIQNSDEAYTNYKWTGLNATWDTWNCIGFSPYTATAGHTYKISGYVRINDMPSGGWINFYHGDHNNDYVNNKMSLSSTGGNWQYFEIWRTFSQTSNTAMLEIYTSTLKGLSGTISFDLKNVCVQDGSWNAPNTIYSMPTNTVNVTAQWAPYKHTVVYDANSGTGAPASQTKTYGVQMNLSSTIPVKTGHTFTGWNTKADGSGTSYSAGQNYTPDQNGGTVTLYAQWTPTVYTNRIAHWAGGFIYGEGNNGAKNMYNFANTTFNATYNSTYEMNTSRQATLPKGFYLTDKFGTGSISGSWDNYPYGTIVTQKADVMGYEYYYYPTTYSVSYNLNGGTNDSGNPKSYNVLYGVTLKNPTKNGYTFAGWTDSSGKEVTGINQGANATFTSQADMYDKLNSRQIGDISLTANWKANSYSVKYNGNGNTGGATATSTHVFDVAKNLTANGFTKTGYSFSKWNTKADGSGTSYADKASVKNLTSVDGATINLYAQWTPNDYVYNIIYKSTSGKQIGTSTITGTFDTSKTVSPIDITGYTKPGSQTVKWDSVTAKTITFIYTPITYNIIIDNNGGTGVSGRTYNVETPTFSIGTPTRVGYTFTGWTGTNGTTPAKTVTIPQGSVGNRTYKANWSINSYVLTFDANGGIVTPGTKKVNYQAPYGTLPTPTRVGYTFTGWYTSKSGGTQVSSSTVMPANNVTIYAHWINYTPEFNGPDVSKGDKNPIMPFMDNGFLIIQKNDKFTPNLYMSVADREDGNITGQVKITNGVPLTNGKATVSGTYNVIYSITDKGGASATYTLKVIVNEPPTINPTDRVFFMNQFKVTNQELLRKVTSDDKEDGNLTSKLKLISIDYGDRVDNNVIELDTTKAGEYTMTYSVTDKYKKTTIKTAKVTVKKNTASENLKVQSAIRFIDDNIKTINKQYGLSDILNINSIWNTDTAMKNKLTESFNNETPDIYEYTNEQIKEIKKESSEKQKTSETNAEFARKYLN